MAAAARDGRFLCERARGAEPEPDAAGFPATESVPFDPGVPVPEPWLRRWEKDIAKTGEGLA